MLGENNQKSTFLKLNSKQIYFKLSRICLHIVDSLIDRKCKLFSIGIFYNCIYTQ